MINLSLNSISVFPIIGKNDGNFCVFMGNECSLGAELTLQASAEAINLKNSREIRNGKNGKIFAFLISKSHQ